VDVEVDGGIAPDTAGVVVGAGANVLVAGSAIFQAHGRDYAAAIQALRNGDFEVAVTAPCNSIVEPDLDIHWFLTTSPVNYGKHKDKMIDELYEKQARAADVEERKKHVRAFEKRLLDEEVHVLWTVQWHRIIPHNSKVKGWTITPSHYLNNQLDTVWLSE